MINTFSIFNFFSCWLYLLLLTAGKTLWIYRTNLNTSLLLNSTVSGRTKSRNIFSNCWITTIWTKKSQEDWFIFREMLLTLRSTNVYERRKAELFIRIVNGARFVKLTEWRNLVDQQSSNELGSMLVLVQLLIKYES